MGNALGSVANSFPTLNHGDHHRRADEEAIKTVQYHCKAIKEIDINLAFLA